MDTYGGGLGVLWVAIFETMVIMWIYGVGRFSDDLRFMLDYKVNILIKICWSITPIILTVIFGIACWFWKHPTYKDTIHGEVHYPEWAHGLGWFLTLIVALQASEMQKHTHSRSCRALVRSSKFVALALTLTMKYWCLFSRLRSKL